MALILSDRVKETTVTSGTGSVVLTGAYGGFQTFSNGIGDSNTTYYCIENEANWEIGIGTYSSSGNSLSRDTVLDSSNSGSKISLNGVSRVFCTLTAKRVVFKDANNDLDLSSTNIKASSVSSTDILSSGLLTLRRTDAGSFFHAYVDDSNDRTITLYSDADTAPEWKLGLKSSPSDATAAPTYAYIYAEDASIGLVGDSLNRVDLQHGPGFVVTNKGDAILKATSSTGVHINATANAHPALTVNGGVSLASDIQRWTTSAGTVLSAMDKDGKLAINQSSASYQLDVKGSGRFTSVLFLDGTEQSTAYTNQDVAVSGWAKSYVDSQDHSGEGGGTSPADLANSASGVAISGWAKAYVNSQDHSGGGGGSSADILANSASGVAISGWAKAYVDSQDHSGGGGSSADILANSASGVVISGIANTNKANIATNVTNIASNLVEIRANSASGVGISGYAEDYADMKVAALVDSAPATLDTLNEIAAAINDDANISTTLTNQITANTTEVRANSASGVVISGIANTNTNTINASGDFLLGEIRVNSASGNTNVSNIASNLVEVRANSASGAANLVEIRTNSASGVVISGIANTNSANITANTNLVHASGDFLLNETRANASSGVVISGIANTNSTNVTANTTAINASGDFLLNETRANAASGVVISGIAAAATYTAGDGLLLTGSEFTLDDPANGTAIDEGTITSSDLMLIWDDDTSSWKYVTIDNLQDEIDTGGGAGSFDNWKFTDGTVAEDTINSAETVIISGISGIVTEYSAGNNTLRISPHGLSGVLQPQITANLNAVNASGDSLLTEIRANSASGNTNATNITSNLTEIRANSASGNFNLTEIRTNSASGNFNLTEIRTNSASGAANLTEIRANSASGVVISGIANNNVASIASNNLKLNASGNANLIEIRANSASGNFNLGEIRANSASGNFNLGEIRTNSASGNFNLGEIRANSASGVAISGYNKGYTDIQIAALVDSAPATLNTLNEIAAAINDDASISTTLTNQITANTTEIRANSASGNFNLGEIRTNSASGVVISGIANTNATNITANTTAVNASGDFLLNETRANAASGVVISGIAAAGGTTYSAGSGIAVVNDTIHFESKNAAGDVLASIKEDNDTHATLLVSGTLVSNAADAARVGVVSIGSGAYVTSDYSIAIGRLAKSVGANQQAIAIGQNAQAQGFAVAIGGESKATTHSYSVAIGYSADANNEKCTSIGWNSRAEDAGVSIGAGAKGENYCVVIGQGADSDSSASVAIGQAADVNGTESVAVGANTEAGANAIALGYFATADNDAVAIGKNVIALTSGVAIGAGANNYLMSGQFNGEAGGSDGFLNFYTPATIINNAAANVPFTVKGAAAQSADLTQWTDSAGANVATMGSAGVLNVYDIRTSGLSVTLGKLATTHEWNAAGAVAIGYNTDVANGACIAIGQSASCTTDHAGQPSIAIGVSSSVANKKAVAIGTSAQASTESVAIGYGANANAGNEGNGGIAIGENANVTGGSAVALGGSTSPSYGGVAVGVSADAGYRGVSVGISANASDFAVALGPNAVAPEGHFVVASGSAQTSVLLSGVFGSYLTIPNTTPLRLTSLEYTDGDDAMTIADGGKVTFAAGFAVGSDIAGDMLYHNGTSYIRLPKGAANDVLTMNDGATAPGWEAPAGGTTLSAGSGIAVVNDTIHFESKNAAGNVLASIKEDNDIHATLLVSGTLVSNAADAARIGVVSIGSGSYTSANNNTAVGGAAKAGGLYSTAIGYNTTANGNYDTVLGYGAKAISNYAVAIGRIAEAQAESVAVGQKSDSAYASVAIGANAQALGSSSIAICKAAEATGSSAIAIGYETDALGDYSIAIGGWVAATTSGLAIGAGAGNYLMSGQFNGEVGGSDGFLNFYTPATIVNNAAANVPLTVKGAGSQSANLQEWKNSAGSLLGNVDEVGTITCNQIVASGLNDSNGNYPGVHTRGIWIGPTKTDGWYTDASTFWACNHSWGWYNGGSKTFTATAVYSSNADRLEFRSNAGTSNFTISMHDAQEFVLNEQGYPVPVRIEGDTDVNLIYASGASDKVGIGSANPWSKLDVAGDIALSTEMSTPTAVAGVGRVYTKSDGKLYFQSGDVTETDLTSGGATLSAGSGIAIVNDTVHFESKNAAGDVLASIKEDNDIHATLLVSGTIVSNAADAARPLCVSIGSGSYISPTFAAGYGDSVAVGAAAAVTGGSYGGGTAIGSRSIAYQYAVAVGHGAKADTHVYSTAVGYHADARNGKSTAIGGQSRAEDAGVSIGYGAEGENACVVIGEGADSDSISSVVIGTSADVNGVNSVAVGANTVAADNAIALGRFTNVTTSGLAIGMGAGNYLMSGQFNGEVGGSTGFLNFYTPATIINNAAANVPFTVKGAAAQSANLQEWKDSAGTALASVKVDNNIHSTLMVSGTIVSNAADAARVGAVSIGSGSYVTSNNSIAIGAAARSVSTGQGAVAIGNNSKAYGPSIAIGQSASSNTHNNSLAIGNGALANSEKCIAIGYGAEATNGGISIGLEAGDGSDGPQNHSVCVGNESYPRDVHMTVIGGNITTSSTARGGMAMGYGSYVGGPSGVALGPYSKANGVQAVAIGPQAIALTSGVAIGAGANNYLMSGQFNGAAGGSDGYLNLYTPLRLTSLEYTDGDDAMTIADGGKVTFAAGFAVGSDAEGDMLYHNGTSYIRLAKGTDNHVLTMNGNVPNWEAASVSATAGGSDTQIQFNDSTVIQGDADLTWNKTTNVMTINGHLAASTKSFLIDHPTKPDMQLQYACLEGPENGVYVRGHADSNIIDLPDYWVGLVDPSSITVQLTPKGSAQPYLFVNKIEDNRVHLLSDRAINAYYTVHGTRKDVAPLQVEI